MKRAEIHACVDSLADELLGLAQALVRIPSMTGQEQEAQRYLAGRLHDWGLAVDRWQPQADELRSHPAFCDDGLPVDREVLVARWGGSSGDKSGALILNGHIDVVPVGDREQWQLSPFSGEIRNGCLHGRGACDMKGGLAAMSVGLRAVQILGIEPKRPVFLQSVTGEETGGVGTLAAILRGYRADAAVIAEPTNLDACPVHSGALSFRLQIEGLAAHGATRQQGISAIAKFWPVFEALQALEHRRHRDFHHPLFDRNTLAAPISIGKLVAGEWLSTVPGKAVAEGRMGVLPAEDCATVKRQFEETVREVCENDDWLREHPVQVDWIEGQFEPGETASEDPILTRLAQAHRRVTGRELRLRGVPYGCDLRLFTRYARMPAVLYGPGDVRLAHSANERIPVADLLTAAKVYADIIYDSVQ